MENVVFLKRFSRKRCKKTFWSLNNYVGDNLKNMAYWSLSSAERPFKEGKKKPNVKSWVEKLLTYHEIWDDTISTKFLLNQNPVDVCPSGN